MQTLNGREIRQQLADILASRTFATAPRLRQFLQFVVEKSLAGEAGEIKEFLIATDVYGRDITYDPQVDSTVRVEASRLRTKLRTFYESEGANAPIEIQLPRGTYVPVFVERTVVQEGEATAVPQPSSPAPARSYLVARGSVIAALVAAVVLSTVSTTGVQARTAPDAEPHVVEAYVRAQKLLRAPVLQNGWPGVVPPAVSDSIRLFRRLTEEAPKFAPAWVGLAEAEEWAYELDRAHPKERIDEAKKALFRALELNPGLPEAWSRLGSIYFHRVGDLTRAETAARKAIELDAREVASHRRLIDLLRIRGRFDEALDAAARAVAVDPANARLWVQRALIYYDTDRYDEALAAAEHALELPGGKQLAVAWSAKGSILERMGRLKEAETTYRSGMSMCPQDVRNRSSLGHLLARTGRRSEARGMLASLMREQQAGNDVSFQLALVHAGLGEPDAALTWLERGRANGQTTMPFLKLEKRFESLAADARYRALVL